MTFLEDRFQLFMKATFDEPSGLTPLSTAMLRAAFFAGSMAAMSGMRMGKEKELLAEIDGCIAAEVATESADIKDQQRRRRCRQ